MNTKKRRKNGFTLIEAMMAAVLLSLVIAALAAASSAFTTVNGYGVDLSTAEFLVEQIRECTTNADFDVLLSTYDGQTYNPPIDMDGTALADFGAFTQSVQVVHVLAGNLDQVDSSSTSDFIRVTVSVTKNGTPLSSTSWIRANLN